MTRKKLLRMPPAQGPADVGAGGFGPILMAVGLTLAALIVVMLVITGPLMPTVLATLCNTVWALTVFVPAAMFGLLLTRPLVKHPLVSANDFPRMYRLILATALGLGFESLATLGLGWLHLLGHGIPALMLLVLAAAGYPTGRDFLKDAIRKPPGRLTPSEIILLLLMALPVATLLVAACFPAGSLWHTEGNGYDVLEYHLQLPKQYLASNSIMPVTGNIYSYLPLNIEMLYMLVGSLGKIALPPADLYELVYGSQMLNVLITLLTAAAIAIAVPGISRRSRLLAALAYLAIPWTLVTGSLAYNDGGACLFGVLALAAVLHAPWHKALAVGGQPQCENCAGAAGIANSTSPRLSDSAITCLLTGILLGLAVGCKMTAGVMFALPVAAILLAGRHWKKLLVTSLVALALYSPWMIRSMAATHTSKSLGNPVFPLFAQTLGMDHWTARLADRFDRGHRPPARLAGLNGHLRALAQQSLLDRQWSPGAAAFAGLFGKTRFTTPPGTPWIARLGIIWLVFVPAALVALLRGRMALMLLLVLVVQVLAWLTCTQLEARFLLPAAVPLVWLTALAADAIGGLPRMFMGMLALQALFCALLLWPEAHLLFGPQPANRPLALGRIFLLPEDWIDEDIPPGTFTANTTIYLEGYSASLYVRGKVIYSTVFDRNLLAQQLRKGPRAAARWLITHRVNYLVVDAMEIARLRRTYGFDRVVTPAAIAAMEPFGITPIPWKTTPGITIYRCGDVGP